MNGKAKLVKLNRDDIKQAVDLVVDSFDFRYLIPSIYRAFNVQKYLEYELLNTFSAYEYNVLKVSQNLVAFSEFKRYPEFVFLNIIATARSEKGNGYGNQLLNDCLESFQNEGYADVMLDVFASNEVAFRWYKKMGFEQASEMKFLYEVPLNKNLSVPVKSNLHIVNYPQARTLLKEIGFAMLECNNGKKQLRLGMINTDVILHNCTDHEEIYTAIYLAKTLKATALYVSSVTADLPHCKKIDGLLRLKRSLK